MADLRNELFVCLIHQSIYNFCVFLRVFVSVIPVGLYVFLTKLWSWYIGVLCSLIHTLYVCQSDVYFNKQCLYCSYRYIQLSNTVNFLSSISIPRILCQ